MKTYVRKGVSRLLILCMVLGLVPMGFAESGSDARGHWAEKEIRAFMTRGYLNGDEKGRVNPDGPITRAQYAVLVNRVIGFEKESSRIGVYSDVKPNAWHRKDMARALEAGYLTGTSETTLSPDTPMTREQNFVVTAKLLKLNVDQSDLRVLDGFSDQGSIASWARKHAAALVQAGYVSGYNGKLMPNKVMSRAEGVSLMSRTESQMLAVQSGQLAPSVKYADGVLMGSAYGYGGMMKVAVKVDQDQKIRGIEVVEQKETPTYYEGVEDKIISQILKKQSVKDIDTVSGATMSSKGLINAVKAALSQEQAIGVDREGKWHVTNYTQLFQAMSNAVDGQTILIKNNITDGGVVDAVSQATVTLKGKKNVTIDGGGYTVSAAPAKSFCFRFEGAKDILVKNLIIDGASFSTKLGGGMYVDRGGQVKLDTVTMKNCRAGGAQAFNGGGAILVEPHGSYEVKDATGKPIIGADGKPLKKAFESKLEAENCIFEDNQVLDGKSGRGGAVYVYNATAVLNNCIFKGNRAAHGGAVAVAGESNITLTNSMFDGTNRAGVTGSDLYLFDGKTHYKHTLYTNAAVRFVLEGNTHRGSNDEFNAYNVVLSRYRDVDQATYPGFTAGRPLDFAAYGHDVLFTNVERTTSIFD